MIRTIWIAVWWFAVLGCVFGARVSAGQEPSDPVVDKLDIRVTEFLEGVSIGDADATKTAYQELLAGSQLRMQTEAVEALMQKTNELNDRYGQYWGFERISAKRVGNDLVLLRYLYKCQNFPVVWYFSFYRTPQTGITAENDNWRLITVRFDTELELLAL